MMTNSLSALLKRINLYNSLLVSVMVTALFFFSSCEKDEIPSVRTRTAFNVSYTSASVSGEVLSDGGSAITERGIVWSEEPNPGMEDNFSETASENEVFTVSLTGLKDATTYYARAYATNSAGTGYGSEVSFTTLAEGYEDPSVIRLGPNSTLTLGDPFISEVEMISYVYNEGPATMNYLTFHTLFPVDRVNQEVIDIEFFPPDPEFVEDDRGNDNIVHYTFNNVESNVNNVTYWRARIKTWELHYSIHPDDVGSLDDIPADISGKYLVDEDVYQINNSIVVNARDDALQGETHPMEMARKIFNWVQNHMTYSIELGWRDAPSNIETGLGSCSGWAYAFIAMCRSAGLPARQSGSLVRRGSHDDPGPHLDQPKHRWAEVYLPNIGWMEANVQGGSWAYLPERYVIIYDSPGTSNLLGNRYDSYRTWSFDGSGSTERGRFGMWWPVKNIGTKPPGPEPVEPENGAEGVPSGQALTWNATDAKSYRLQVSTCENFSTIQYYKPDVTGESHIPMWTGSEGTTYYWRVSASNIAGTSDWSDVWSFTR